MEIKHPIAYWRKANQIHQWFVANVQNGNDDCGSYWVELGQLEALRDVCKGVLDGNLKDVESLPTTSGFFFGSTEYDEWYKEDLENTIEQLNPIIERSKDTKAEFAYRSSW